MPVDVTGRHVVERGGDRVSLDDVVAGSESITGGSAPRRLERLVAGEDAQVSVCRVPILWHVSPRENDGAASRRTHGTAETATRRPSRLNATVRGRSDDVNVRVGKEERGRNPTIAHGCPAQSATGRTSRRQVEKWLGGRAHRPRAGVGNVEHVPGVDDQVDPVGRRPGEQATVTANEVVASSRPVDAGPARQLRPDVGVCQVENANVRSHGEDHNGDRATGECFVRRLFVLPAAAIWADCLLIAGVSTFTAEARQRQCRRDVGSAEPAGDRSRRAVPIAAVAEHGKCQCDHYGAEGRTFPSDAGAHQEEPDGQTDDGFPLPGEYGDSERRRFRNDAEPTPVDRDASVVIRSD